MIYFIGNSYLLNFKLNFCVLFASDMNSMFVLTENENQRLEVQRFDCSFNPAKLVDSWDEIMWDTAVTSLALYDCVPSILLAEKHLAFTSNSTVP